MTLGERLKKCRTEKGLSQEQAAELIGVSRQAVTKWENGQSVPSSKNLLELAALYGLSVDELATGGSKGDKHILHMNLSLIAIISQAAFLNVAMKPFQLAEIPSLRMFELAFKFVPLLAASVWMARNLRYEKNEAQYRKNVKIELAYCLVQLTVALFGHYSGLQPLGTLLLMTAVLGYIFVINPKYMNRRMTRERKK